MNDEILNKTVEILNKTVNETLGSMSTSACIYNNTDYCEGIIPLALAWETSAVIIGIAALGCLTQKYGPQVSDCLCGFSQDSVFSRRPEGENTHAEALLETGRSLEVHPHGIS